MWFILLRGYKGIQSSFACCIKDTVHCWVDGQLQSIKVTNIHCALPQWHPSRKESYKNILSVYCPYFLALFQMEWTVKESEEKQTFFEMYWFTRVIWLLKSSWKDSTVCKSSALIYSACVDTKFFQCLFHAYGAPLSSTSFCTPFPHCFSHTWLLLPRCMLVLLALRAFSVWALWQLLQSKMKTSISFLEGT